MLKWMFSMTNCWYRRQLANLFWMAKTSVINHIYDCFLLYYTHNTYLFQESVFLQNLLIQRCHLPSMLLGSSKPFWSLFSGKLRLLKWTVTTACWISHHYFLLLQQLRKYWSRTHLWYLPRIVSHYPTERMTYQFISYKDNKAAKQLNYIPKETGKLS